MQENPVTQLLLCSLENVLGLKAIWCSTNHHSVIFPLSPSCKRWGNMNLALWWHASRIPVLDSVPAPCGSATHSMDNQKYIVWFLKSPRNLQCPWFSRYSTGIGWDLSLDKWICFHYNIKTTWNPGCCYIRKHLTQLCPFALHLLLKCICVHF